MAISAKIGSFNDLKCLELDLSDAAWQAVLADKVSLLRSSDNKMNLFSFISGDELMTIELLGEDVSQLNDQEFLGINMHNLPQETAAETLMVKHEKFDLTGKFLLGIRAHGLKDYTGAIDCYLKLLSKNLKLLRFIICSDSAIEQLVIT